MGKGRGGRATRGSKEYSEVQELRKENQQLRSDVRSLTKKLASLRRQVGRANPEKYEAVVALLHQQREEDSLMHTEAKTRAAKKEQLLKKWACHHCTGGTLTSRMWEHPIRKIMMYYRKCNRCPHKTEMKPYSDSVDLGIREDEPMKE